MATEVVRLICPDLQCRTILSVPAAARGRTVRCRLCGTRVIIPQQKPSHHPLPTEKHGVGNAGK